MLAVTEAAAEAITALTATEGHPDTGGLRFAVRSQDGATAALEMSVADQPNQDDQVVGSAGAQVFLAPDAVVYLDDKVLDVQKDVDGQLNFAVRQQG